MVFAAVEGLDDRQIAHLFLQETGNAEKVFAAFAAGHFAPAFFVSAAGRFDRLLHVGRRPLRDFGMLLLGGGIDRGEIFAGRRLDEFAADEEVVARLDFEVGVDLGGGRVVPALVETQVAVAHRNDHGMRGRRGQGGHPGGEFFGFLAHGREK
jgi:hypothetical protein